jgi:hypothetical protein
VAKTFEQAWAKKQAEGYQYGKEALDNVRFGWEIAYEVLAEELRDAIEKKHVGPLPQHTWKRRFEHGSRLPERCKGCGEPLLIENLFCEDGCPCNTPRGINFSPKPCKICEIDCCVRPGHRLAELFGDYVHTDLGPPPPKVKRRGVDFPCENCGKSDGSSLSEGWYRCTACGYPGK